MANPRPPPPQRHVWLYVNASTGRVVTDVAVDFLGHMWTPYCYELADPQPTHHPKARPGGGKRRGKGK